MPDPKRLEEAKEWLQYAADDLAGAELLLRAAPPRIRQALFGAQQAVEKALKAFLIWHGRSYPLTHNLTLLRDVCGEIDESLMDIVAPALALTDFAVRFRYPGALPAELDLEDARTWVEAAHRIYGVIACRVSA